MIAAFRCILVRISDKVMASLLDGAGEDDIEFLFGDEAILVDVGSVDKLIDFGVRDVLTELGSDPTKVLG